MLFLSDLKATASYVVYRKIYVNTLIQVCINCIKKEIASMPWYNNSIIPNDSFDTFRPRRNGCHFSDDIFKCKLLEIFVF